jgi:hypothetical protein
VAPVAIAFIARPMAGFIDKDINATGDLAKIVLTHLLQLTTDILKKSE